MTRAAFAVGARKGEIALGVRPCARRIAPTANKGPRPAPQR